MPNFRWAIFGTGMVSHKFSKGVLANNDASIGFAASRSIISANMFAKSYAGAIGVEGYDPKAYADQVDAVYIATPAEHHADHAIRCLENGIPTIIEKPFASDFGGAKRIVEAAKANNVFCMEAMWTRFIPAVREAKALIESGVIGKIHLMTGGFALSQDASAARYFDPVSGGSMLYFGVYPLSLGRFFAGRMASLSSAVDTNREVDTTVVLSVRYESGALGSYHAGLHINSDNGFAIYGDAGSIRFSPIFRPSFLELVSSTPRSEVPGHGGLRNRLKDSALAHRINHIVSGSSALTAFKSRRLIKRPYVGNGYYHEVAEAMAAVSSSSAESHIMPLNESVEIMSFVDQIRKSESRLS